jgi:8-oxo-dGTP diphosphatase
MARTEPASLRFGEPEPGVAYRDRPAAFGVAARGGRIAVVRVTKPGQRPWLDLPGGALDPGEDDGQALVREFGEETGLVVRPGPLLCRADQLFRKADDEPVNNRSGLYGAQIAGEDASLKIEADHELLWIEPQEAIRRLRHESHAWAVAAWLRQQGA